MFSLNDGFQYWLYKEPTDMRKSFYTLSGIVRKEMNHDPLDGSVYIFLNKYRNRIKLLHMEPGGLVLYSKILEKGTMHFPDKITASVSPIEWRDLVLMVEGIITHKDKNFPRIRRVQKVRKSSF